VKYPVKTLAALALVGFVAPSAMAVSIKDDVVSMKLKGNVQFRASLLNDATDNFGNDYDPLRQPSNVNAAGASNGIGQSAEAARFDIRRARIGFEAKLGDWTGNVTIRSDKNDTAVGGGGGTSAGRAVQLYYANISRDFKAGELTHQIRMGLDKSFHAESTQSSSTFLFATDTIVDEKVEERGVGIGYRLVSPFINFGADFHNNSTGTKDADADNKALGDTNGYFYSFRIEVAPGAEFMPAKRTHSFAGKEGTHLVLGVDAQWDTGNLNAANIPVTTPPSAFEYGKKDTFTWGPDLLAHWNGLTALAEYRMRSVKQKNTDTTAALGTVSIADVKSVYWDIQAGYAMPLDEFVIEPAIGYMVNDADKDNSGEQAVYNGSVDNGGSGKTINVGVNFYWNGHDNKTQISYQNWKAESGSGDANIVRIQHQINF
jgi:hypothetical protein